MNHNRRSNQDDNGCVRIPLRGKYGLGLFALVDGDGKGQYLAGFKWSVKKNGYVSRSRLARCDPPGKHTIYLHKEVCKALTGHWIDHINRDKLDNRSVNLRSVPPKVNANNRTQRKVRSASRSGYRGVVHQTPGSFAVRLSRSYVGAYPTAIAAAKAYDRAAYARYGEDAVLNFPEEMRA